MISNNDLFHRHKQRIRNAENEVTVPFVIDKMYTEFIKSTKKSTKVGNYVE